VHFLRIVAIRAVARNRDEAFGLTPDRVGFGTGGLDALMDKKLFDKVATERDAGAGRPS
jgi:hypothetical protein